MPLAEAAVIVGLITNTIRFIELSRGVYDAARSVHGLHQAFIQVSDNVPLVLNILRNCEKIQKQTDESYRTSKDPSFKQRADDSAKAVRPVLQTCRDNAEKLGEIFNKVIPGEEAGWVERYAKAVRQVMPGKQRKVEDLMKEILQKLDLLRTDRFFRNEVERQHERLTEAIQGLEDVGSSLPEGDGRFVHSGSGPLNALTGSGTLESYLISGGTNAKMYNGKTMYFGKDEK